MNTTLFYTVQRYVTDVYQEFMFGLVDEDAADIGLFISELRGGYHLQYLHADEPIRALWERIEDNAAVAEFVVRGTIHFKARLLADRIFEDWKDVIAGAFSGLFGGEARRKSAIVSRSYWEKQATKEYLTQILEDDVWLLFVLSLELCVSQLGNTDGIETTA